MVGDLCCGQHGDSIHGWYTKESAHSGRRQMGANRRSHHSNVTDQREQRIRQEAAEHAEDQHIGNGVEAAERRHAHEGG